MSGPKLLQSKRNLTFGRYRFLVRERVLERDGRPVAIPEKTLEVLRILLEHAGQLVEKDALKQEVWPGIFVEDTNIAFQISTLRKLLEESASSPQLIATVPKRGYRFIGEVTEETEPEALESVLFRMPQPPPDVARLEDRPIAARRGLWIGFAALAILVAAVLTFTSSRPRPVTALGEKGTIVLADFENKTGDPVFDGTLRQGLLVVLGQSPFLSLLSEQRLQRTLRLMRQPLSAPLTHEVAMGACQRTDSSMLVEGSIEQVGGLYVLGLRATDCEAGNLIDAEQEKAGTKERVLDALSSMAARFRRRVGESAATLRRHNASLAEATTSSAEALKAYTAGWSVHTSRGAGEAIPLLHHAVQLDGEFAMAYAALGRMYADLDESDLCVKNLQKAWALKDHTSERERFFISANYLSLVTGDLEEARKVATAWTQTYPRDAVPQSLLSGLLNKAAGRYEEAAFHARRAIEMDPDFGISYYNLGVNNLYLQRFDAADRALAEGKKRGLEIEEYRMLKYDLAFLRRDMTSIDRIVSETQKRPESLAWLNNHEAFRAAYAGHIRRARSIAESAVVEAERSNQRERAGVWEVGEALREAMTGNVMLAKRSAESAMALTNDREVRYGAALALAIIGDPERAANIADALEKQWPEDTSVRFVYLPVIRAQIALSQQRPELAVDVLKKAAPMELGVSRSPINTVFGGLYPIYFRGLAYCALGKGKEAVVEFEKIVDHSGIVASDLVGALVKLQLGRAYRIAGDQASAKKAYRDFWDAWKDADADLPLLRTARSEYFTYFHGSETL